MAVPFYGDYDTTETVHIPFNTFSSDNPSASVTVTDLAQGDIEIHKDGSATQRASDSGVSVSINFDTVTGNHMVHIDLSDNDDAGFYAAGSRYQVRLEGITVDGATLNVWIGAFSVGCTLRPTTAGRTLSVHVTGDVEADMVKVSGSAGALLALDEYWSGIYAEAGTAQAGDTQSITLASGNSAEDDFYKNDFIYLVDGTGTGQCRRIVSYTGSTRVATITSSWAINPSTDTVYLIIPGAGANAEWIAGTPIGGSGTEGDPWGPV